MSQTIASTLKQLRKASRLSAKQAASQLKHYGIDIAPKTLYGYESGLSMPNADVFVALCSIYHCSEPATATEPAAAGQNPSQTDNMPNTAETYHPAQANSLPNTAEAYHPTQANSLPDTAESRDPLTVCSTERGFLHPDELSLLNDYKGLDPFGQDLVRQIIAHEKERIRQLNDL